VRIAPIVEGQGDVASIPIIIRRVAFSLGVQDCAVLRPVRIPRDRLVREGELERAIERTARASPQPAAILVIFDADDAVPCRLGPELLRRALQARPDVRSAVVLATKEKEAWFLAAALSLAGHRGLGPDLVPPPDPEGIRGAKEWLSRAMGRPYSEIADEPALSAFFDLNAARTGSPSFDKFCREVERLLA
jgi:hypothetical protein